MITIGLFFIAACTVLLVVSSHSTLLINETIKNISQIVLGIASGLFLVGLFLYIKDYKKITLNKKKKGLCIST